MLSIILPNAVCDRDKVLYLEHGKPMIFGKDRNQGIRMNGAHPEVVTIGEGGITEADILVHDINLQDPSVAFMLARMEQPDFPQPVGVFSARSSAPSYDQMLTDQIDTAIAKSGPGTLEKTDLHRRYVDGRVETLPSICRLKKSGPIGNRKILNRKSKMICPSCGHDTHRRRGPL